MNEEIIFDAKSGISIEEQKEILARINAIAEKNKQRLSQNAHAHGGAPDAKPAVVKEAKKKPVFPVAFNAAAALVLAAGTFLLFSFNGKIDIQARSGSAVYNLTEKALIEEIRRETSEKIAAKEMEISLISLRLAEVDAQLSLLQGGNQELTSEQLASLEGLLQLQRSYRGELAALNEERSRILEESRLKEENLRVILDERTRNFTAAQQGYSKELEQTVSELERLTSEQERIASIDAQFSGGIALISELIKTGSNAEAAAAIQSLRDFCDIKFFAYSVSLQSRRLIYNQSLDFMEAVIGRAADSTGSRNGDAGDQGLLLSNARLEQTIAEMQKTIDSFTSGGTGLERRLAELEETVASLRSDNAALEQEAAAKDRTISAMQGENSTLTAANASLTSTNAALTSTNTNLTSQLNRINTINSANELRIRELEDQLKAAGLLLTD